MTKLEILFQKIGFDYQDFNLTNIFLKKIEIQSVNNHHLFYIFAKELIPINITKKLIEKIKNFPYSAEIIFQVENSNNKNIFKEYYEDFCNLNFIGKEFSEINAGYLFEDKFLTIEFNFETQMNLYNNWKELIKNYFSKFGFNFQVIYKLKVNHQKLLNEIEINKTNELIKELANIEKKVSNKVLISGRNEYKIIKKSKKCFPIIEIGQEPLFDITIEGELISKNSKITKQGFCFWSLSIYDGTSSIIVKVFGRTTKEQSPLFGVKIGSQIQVFGNSKYDDWEKEMILIANSVVLVAVDKMKRIDDAPRKRIELHAHTKMSAFDGLANPLSLMKQAIAFDHKGIAFCDIDNVQAFPDIMAALKIIQKKNNNFKAIYGIQLKIINQQLDFIKNPIPVKLEDAKYIIFDLETTGLSATNDKIIEFAAVKIQDNCVIEQLEFLINPEEEISPKIIELTGITNEELIDKGIKLSAAIKKITNFIEPDSVLVAHNAQFDIGFLKKIYINSHLGSLNNPVIDTLQLSWRLIKKQWSYRLGRVAKTFGVYYDEKKAHRAMYDVEILKNIFYKLMKKIMHIPQIKLLSDLNYLNTDSESFLKQIGCDATLLIKNQKGVADLYKIISEAHTKYLGQKRPSFPRELLKNYRDNLFIAASSNNSEIIELALNNNLVELEEAMIFYDYIEIMPIQNYCKMWQIGMVPSITSIKKAIERIIKSANLLDKLVVVVGDVFYLNPDQKQLRSVYIEAKQLNGAPHYLKDYQNRISEQPNKHFKTTQEMLAEFNWLGTDISQKIVIRNPQIIADSIKQIRPIKEGLYVPEMVGVNEKIAKLCYDNAHKIYGETLPSIVTKRLKKELTTLETHNYNVVYYLSHLIVKKSLEDGYLVGSRGSVGSSLVATMTEITEVNPLAPHYLCNCTYSNFNVESHILNGFDLSPMKCPKCASVMYGQGHNIPFETFLGFKGEKIPDIDLNFSSNYQQIAHNYARELIGKDNVFRAGTISTVQEKTAFGFVKGYLEATNQESIRKSEIKRLAIGCVGTKRTTGQHPGGIIVIPKNYSIYDFTPINYPANKKDINGQDWKTTHFDFHSIHNNLLKLDILGHVDPTAIRMLQDITKVNPHEIPFYDLKVMKLFYSQESLNLKHALPFKEKTGAIGIPEFGTPFVRKMLEETKPQSFSDLIILSGLSHGTDVYNGNARNLITKKNKKLTDVIGCRDDIMVYLISMGLSEKDAFETMEFIRKGKINYNLDEWTTYKQTMEEHKVPQWWIESCGKIKYLFPKAHATAYVMMAWRVAWFKVYYPLEYYAVLFSLRCDSFDIETILQGQDVMEKRYQDLINRYNDYNLKRTLSPKEIELIKVLEMAIEMYSRGYEFTNISLTESTPDKFVIDKERNVLIPPFAAIDGLGVVVGENVVDERNQKPFSSINDMKIRTKLNKSHIEIMTQLGVLKNLNISDQMHLF